jgi:acyl-coenzyme A thioesterase PaaI-like protein
MSILDSAMVCAVQSTLPQGTGYTTLEIKVNFTRPVLQDTGRPHLRSRIDDVPARERPGRREGAEVSARRRLAADPVSSP